MDRALLFCNWQKCYSGKRIKALLTNRPCWPGGFSGRIRQSVASGKSYRPRSQAPCPKKRPPGAGLALFDTGRYARPVLCPSSSGAGVGTPRFTRRCRGVHRRVLQEHDPYVPFRSPPRAAPSNGPRGRDEQLTSPSRAAH